MASTIELQRTVNLAQSYLRYAPLTFATDSSNNLAYSNADWVMQTILAPPFAWRWNRAAGTVSDPTFVTKVGVTDYSVALANFGWIEKAVAYNVADGTAAYELKVDLVLGSETTSNQPTRIVAQYDDDNGNITFRMFPAPDAEYNVVVDYQKSASNFSSLTQAWSPIPDYMSYVYNLGFIAKAFDYAADPRFGPEMQMFYQALAAVSEGLSSTQRNIWLQDRLNSLRETLAVQTGRK